MPDSLAALSDIEQAIVWVETTLTCQREQIMQLESVLSACRTTLAALEATLDGFHAWRTALLACQSDPDSGPGQSAGASPP